MIELVSEFLFVSVCECLDVSVWMVVGFIYSDVLSVESVAG